MAPTTETLAPDRAGIARGAALLAAGGLVAFPTETVYGLGADARRDSAVAGIYAAKGRPAVNPLIVHLAEPAQAAALARMTPLAERLAGAFWPGPLTLVLPLRDGHGLSDRVTAGLGTVGLRVPDAPVARALLGGFGGPVAAPSANPSGGISPTTAAHVLDGLAGRIDAVIDGGACSVGLESTIVDLSGETPRLLRAGAVSVEEMSAAAGLPVTGDGRETEDTAPTAPGQMTRHYAPRTPLRLNASDPRPGELMLGFGPGTGYAENLSPAGDLREAAANLFAALHRLDHEGAQRIAVAPIPDTGIGRALNDRLRRAATPRG
ncbi:MAG: L-threonylcarbamoyladenylate synthase [Pseudomonadota bacterium]